jgi:hypothetical protein
MPSKPNKNNSLFIPVYNNNKNIKIVTIKNKKSRTTKKKTNK